MSYSKQYLQGKLNGHLNGNSNGNGHVPELSARQAIQDLSPLPVRARRLIRAKTTGEEDRSSRLYELAALLAEAGATGDQAFVILRPTVWNKFRGRGSEVHDLWQCVREASSSSGKRRAASDVPGSSDAGAGAFPEARKLKLKGADTVPLRPTDWLWDLWVPMGCLTVLAGRQGNGKSTWTAHLASLVTRGKLGRSPSDVLFASLEDSATQTIAPRLKAALCDMKRVHLMEGVDDEDGRYDILRIPRDAELIAQAAKETKSSLVVIDPIVATLDGGSKFDSYKDADVRRVLAPLAMAAERGNFAVVSVMHLKKKQEDEAMMGVGGSIAFTAAARSVLIMGYPSPDGVDYRENDRVLAHAKSNLGPLQPSRHLRLREVRVGGGNIVTSRVHDVDIAWEEAEDIKLAPERGKKLLQAMDMLHRELATGPKPAADLIDEAYRMGISLSKLRQAKKKMGVKASGAKGRRGVSYWSSV